MSRNKAGLHISLWPLSSLAGLWASTQQILFNDHKVQLVRLIYIQQHFKQSDCFRTRIIYWHLVWRNPISSKQRAFNGLHKMEYVWVCLRRDIFAFKGCSWESACVPCFSKGIWEFQTHSQLYWWLARYGWPVSAWVLMTLKTTRVAPISAPSHADFFHAALKSTQDNKERHVPQYTNPAAEKPLPSDAKTWFFLKWQSFWLCCWEAILRFPWKRLMF